MSKQVEPQTNNSLLSANASARARDPAWRLYLFGAFRLERASPRPERIHLLTRKIESLLAFLALHPAPHIHSREQLAALLWGDFSQKQAYDSLRNALPALRKIFGADILVVERDTVQLRADALWINALEFATQADAFLRATDPDLEHSPLDLYRGDLLADFDDEWIAPLREQYRAQYVRVLLRVAETWRSQGEYARAIETAQKIIQLDAANEAAQQLVMFAYAAQGNRAAALRQYEEFANHLRAEYNIEPSAETTALFHSLRAETARATPRVITNVPAPLTSFIGRETQVAELTQRVMDSRLVTLIGTGGVGKTRLAIQIASRVAAQFADGAWWVELAALHDAFLVPQTVAKTLGVQEIAGRAILETLVEFLRAKNLLLILDNCEHLRAACAALANRLLTQCPNLRVLATSREALGITGEVIWNVPTLTLPELEVGSWKLEVGSAEATRLFIERARAVKMQSALTAENAPMITNIARRLDGIPLALELAAARVKTMNVEQIAAGLNERFVLLGLDNVAVLPRHQTLRAALDWSFHLLTTEEQILFQRVGVFAGGFTLDAAAHVTSDAARDSATSTLIASALLARLADKSLVLIEYRDDAPRYRLLETLREYALEQLVLNAGEGLRATDGVIRERHLDYFLRRAEFLGLQLSDTNQARSLDELEIEHDNLRGALRYALEQQHIERGLHLTLALAPFWRVRGYFSQARGWFQEFLRADADAMDFGTRHFNPERAMLRARALNAAGQIVWAQGDYDAAEQFFQESMNLHLDLEDQLGIADALGNLGYVAYQRGDTAAARTRIHESISLLREVGATGKPKLAEWLNNYGNVCYTQGDYRAARAGYAESLALREELGNQQGIVAARINLGRALLAEGEIAAARELLESARPLAQELGFQLALASCLDNLGEVARTERDYAGARELYQESLLILRELGLKFSELLALTALGQTVVQLGDYAAARECVRQYLALTSQLASDWGYILVLDILAALAAAHDDALRAATLYAAAEQARARLGARADPLYYLERERWMKRAGAWIDEQVIQEAWMRGKKMTAQEALAFGLEGEKLNTN